MPRRKIEDMPAWEQAVKRAATKGRKGWGVREKRGRVVVEYRAAGKTESVFLPQPITYSSQFEDDICAWLRDLYKAWNNGAVTLAVALETVAPTSDKVGSTFGASWQEIRDSLKVRKMTEGRKIQLKSWEDNYERFINHAIEQIRRHNPSDGKGLLRLAAKKWQDKQPSRAALIIALKAFTEHAVREFNAPNSWIIDEYDASSVRGQEDEEEKRITATLTQIEALTILKAVEERWGAGWGNVIRILMATGIRPVELQHLEVRVNDDGQKQLWCRYRKPGGRRRTEPRWLEELPLTDKNENTVFWNLAEQYEAMEYPIGRDGLRRKLNAHYCELKLKKVEAWLDMKTAKDKNGKWLRTYSFRNSWDAWAHQVIGNQAAIFKAMGNSASVNARSYVQADDATTRAAFSAVRAG